MTDAALTNSIELFTRTQRLGKVSLCYFEVGEKSAPTIVLCHGLGAGKEQFEDDARYFAQQGFHVIVPDLRGHGRSETPPQYGEGSFSLVSYANDILEIAAALEIDKIHFVGNSLGGLVGLMLMRLKPALIASIATFGTTYSLKVSSLTMGIATFVNKIVPPEWAGQLGAKSVSRNEAGQALMKKLLSAARPQTTAHTMTHIADYDLISIAEGSSIPVLILRAEFDKQINDAIGPTLKALERKENVKIVEVPGAAHCANLDAPDEIRAELLQHFARA